MEKLTAKQITESYNRLKQNAVGLRLRLMQEVVLILLEEIQTPELN